MWMKINWTRIIVPERIPDVVIDLNENIDRLDILSYWKDVDRHSIRSQYDSTIIHFWLYVNE